MQFELLNQNLTLIAWGSNHELVLQIYAHHNRSIRYMSVGFVARVPALQDSKLMTHTTLI